MYTYLYNAGRTRNATIDKVTSKEISIQIILIVLRENINR